ncbi:MAG: DAK2 domain-containing protein [Anaerolineae bacterium]
MHTPQLINGLQLKDMFIAGNKWLKKHVAHVNTLNVFPVPDGDTGTNMFLTLQAALKNMQPYSGSHAGDLAALASQGALMGARGNSGVILSQILNGFSEAFAGKESFSTAEFAHALTLGSNKAYSAVMNPVEGTILTIIKEAARIGHAAAGNTPKIGEFLTEVLDGARAMLRLTPELLPVLKEAGVVDSGGQGLVYFLEGMHRHIKGLPLEADSGHDYASPASVTLPAQAAYIPGFDYDVQFLIKGRQLNIDAIRQTIAAMGDCPLVVGNEQLAKVHVHAADPGAPISYGATQGALLNVVVENMAEQYRQLAPSNGAAPQATQTGIATLCVSPGPGLSKVFRSLGAAEVIGGGQTMNPSAAEIVQAINRTAADQIIVLPNNGNIILTAQQAGPMTAKAVRVIPATTVPQGINALLAFNPEADLDSNTRRMTDALEHVHTIEITRAVKNATVNHIQIDKQAVIGLLNGALVAVGQEINPVILDAIAQTDVANLEIVTLYYGQNVTPQAAQTLAAQITQTHPHLDVEIINGGQPHYPYIVSLE